MNDWLGNTLEKGDVVVYSSKSSLTGMNLGEITSIDNNRIQIRLWAITERFRGTTYMPQRIVTLLKGSSAHKSVTRYFGKLPNKDEA
jgi:hypothetical protein